MYIIKNRRIGGADRQGIGEYFSAKSVDEIVSGAYEILARIGIRVLDGDIQNRLRQKGFEIKGNRVVIPACNARGYLEDSIRRRSARKEQQESKDKDISYDGWINTYPYQYEHPESSHILPFDTESLTGMTRFIEAFSRKRGFTPSVPGYPNDVPPSLQGLIRYKIWAENCSRGWNAEPTSRLSARYLFDMAEVMGQKIDHLPVYAATPLTLGDESFYIVLENAHRLKSVSVGSMPSFGANTPLSVSAAFSLVLAELLGCAVIINELTGLPVDFDTLLYPFDFHTLNMVFGSPEKLIFEWISLDFNAKLFGTGLKIPATDIHTCAKKAGVQAAVEKGTLMMAGALNGAARFIGLGALSLDEIFSPVQLVLDIEILNHVARVVAGIGIDAMPEDLCGMMEEGIERGFIGTDLTLENHDSYIWYSDLFDRSNLQAWMMRGEGDALERARDIVRQCLCQPVEYILEASKKKALDQIFSQALKDAGHS